MALVSNATSELHVFFLGAWGHPAFHRNYQKNIDYIMELCRFLKFYLKQRYQVDTQVHSYWPAPTFTGKIRNYDDIKKFDGLPWVHDYFGNRLQLYCGYGMRLKPYDEERKRDGLPSANGYCECHAGRFSADTQLKKEDFMYVDMPVYETTGFWGFHSICQQLSDFSRVCTHELDHQILLLTRFHGGHIGPVHRAALKPPICWTKTPIGYASSPQPKASDVWFLSQVDPRTV